MKYIQKNFKAVSVGILAPVILGTSLFFFLAILNNRPVSWGMFYALLLPLGILSGGMVYWFWKIRDQFSKKFQLFMILWSGIAVWFWVFAPIYYLFTINLDPHQIAITGFAFAWEVPIIGGIFIAACLLRFRKINRAITDKDSIKNADSLYDFILKYPRDVAILIAIFSFIGYFIGSLQLHVLGASPNLELVKNSILGLVVASFIALFYYLILDLFLRDTLQYIEREFKIRKTKTRKLRNEILGKTLLVTIGSLAFIGLIVFQSWQVIIVGQIEEQLRQKITLIDTESGFDANGDFDASLKRQYGDNSGIIIIEEGEEFREDGFKQLTQDSINSKQEGVLEDLKDNHTVIVFSTHPTSGEKAILLADASFAYKVIGSVGTPFVFAAIFILSLIVIVNILIAFALTSAVNHIFFLIKRADKEDISHLEPLPSVNELSVLSRIFIDYAKRNKQLHEAERNFISIASHQLRTPLLGISWVVELLFKRGGLEDRQREYLNYIDSSTKRLSDLVDVLLNIARIDAGKDIELNPESVDLEELTKDCISDLKPVADRNNISLIFKKPSKKITARTDPRILGSITQVLVSNAIQYTPKKGRVEMSWEKEADDFIFKVKDNGVGIPLSEQEHIFDKFTRTKKAKSMRPTGTGLGLYLSKQMAGFLGGAIWFESEEDKGTTFYIKIPKNLEK